MCRCPVGLGTPARVKGWWAPFRLRARDPEGDRPRRPWRARVWGAPSPRKHSGLSGSVSRARPGLGTWPRGSWPFCVPPLPLLKATERKVRCHSQSPRNERHGRHAGPWRGGGAGFGGRRELGAHVPAGGWASATRGPLHRVILGLRATRGLLGAWSLLTQAEGCHLLGAGPVGRAGSDRPGCRWAIPSRALSCP